MLDDTTFQNNINGIHRPLLLPACHTSSQPKKQPQAAPHVFCKWWMWMLCGCSHEKQRPLGIPDMGRSRVGVMFLSKVKGFYYLILLITSSKDASPTCQEHLTQWLVTAILGFPSPVFQHGHRVLHIDTRRLPPVVVSHLFISCLAGILLIPCI